MRHGGAIKIVLLSWLCLVSVPAILWTYLFVQIAPAADPISGRAGWVGAGLLGLVLAWLLFWHLPAKDKQVADLIKDFREESKEQRKANKEALDQICIEFKNDTTAERQSCERNQENLAKRVTEAILKIGGAHPP